MLQMKSQPLAGIAEVGDMALSKIAHGHEEILRLLEAYHRATATADPLAQKEAIESLAAYVLSPSKLARVLEVAILEQIYGIFRNHRSPAAIKAFAASSSGLQDAAGNYEDAAPAADAAAGAGGSTSSATKGEDGDAEQGGQAADASSGSALPSGGILKNSAIVEHQQSQGQQQRRPTLDAPLFGDLEAVLETRRKELILLRRYYGTQRQSRGRGAPPPGAGAGSLMSTTSVSPSIIVGGRGAGLFNFYSEELLTATSPVSAAPASSVSASSPLREGPTGRTPGAASSSTGAANFNYGNGARNDRPNSASPSKLTTSPIRGIATPHAHTRLAGQAIVQNQRKKRASAETWGHEHAAIKINNPNNKQHAPVYYIPTRSGANNFVKNPTRPPGMTRPLGSMPNLHFGGNKHASRPAGAAATGTLNKHGSGTKSSYLQQTESMPSAASSTAKDSYGCNTTAFGGKNARAASSIGGGAAAEGTSNGPNMMESLYVAQMSSGSVKIAEQYPLDSVNHEKISSKPKAQITDANNLRSRPGKYTLLYREEAIFQAQNANRVSNIPENAHAGNYSLGTLAAHFNEDTTRWLVRQQHPLSTPGFATTVDQQKKQYGGTAGTTGGHQAIAPPGVHPGTTHHGGAAHHTGGAFSHAQAGHAGPGPAGATVPEKFDIFQDTVDWMLAQQQQESLSAGNSMMNSSDFLVISNNSQHDAPGVGAPASPVVERTLLMDNSGGFGSSQTAGAILEHA
ncbi:unnamed protein product [Amoebophrya sp. A25]|nr:unnamed protein product [Amoebophrya sp. A25]|eukprot:GSA25T00017539001.1